MSCYESQNIDFVATLFFIIFIFNFSFSNVVIDAKFNIE